VKHLLFLSIICSPVLFTNCGEGISIGDYHQGGIVFHIFEKGDAGYVAGEVHGLIAAPNDIISEQQWTKCYGLKTITGAKGTDIGRGYQNTQDIVAQCKEDNTPAALCNNSDVGGYNDWFLPSIAELLKMYENIGQGSRENIGQFSDNGYWSSSKVVSKIEGERLLPLTTEDGIIVYLIDFNTGELKANNGVYTNDVRAIRAF